MEGNVNREGEDVVQSFASARGVPALETEGWDARRAGAAWHREEQDSWDEDGVGMREPQFAW